MPESKYLRRRSEQRSALMKTPRRVDARWHVPVYGIKDFYIYQLCLGPSLNNLIGGLALDPWWAPDYLITLCSTHLLSAVNKFEMPESAPGQSSLLIKLYINLKCVLNLFIWSDIMKARNSLGQQSQLSPSEFKADVMDVFVMSYWHHQLHVVFVSSGTLM